MPVLDKPTAVPSLMLFDAERMIAEAFGTKPLLDDGDIYLFWSESKRMFIQKFWDIKKRGTDEVKQRYPLLCFSFRPDPVTARDGEVMRTKRFSWTEACGICQSQNCEGLVEIEDKTGDSIRWNGKPPKI